MKKYRLSREIPIEEGYDVVIAGGGPAGCAAAICAARLGAKVLLVESTGCLGGMATSGLVSVFDSMADGEKMITGGFMKELIETMYERGVLVEGINPDLWRKSHGGWTGFKPEDMKRLLDELTMDAGVEVRFFTNLIDMDADGTTVNGAILHNIEGYSYIKAKAYIDCTGDAVMADLAGAKCLEAGRDTPKIMPPTLISMFGGIDFENFDSWEEQQEDLKRALADNHFTQPDRCLAGLGKRGSSFALLNAGHIFNLNALRCRSLSDGMMLGRKLAVEYREFFRKYVGGCENIELITTAAIMGVRESRRIIGEYMLTFDDYKARRQFPDQIGVHNKPVDIHPYKLGEESHKEFTDLYTKSGKMKPGECAGMPYGILVPKGFKNLWVAGRCVSTDTEVHGAIRVQVTCAMMGEAAGTAAAQAINTGQAACELDTEALVAMLRKKGGYLPQETLSKEMTRSA